MFLNNTVNRFARWLSPPAQAQGLPARSCGCKTPGRAARRGDVRQALLEQMEPRCLMAADLIQIGAVYIEEDLGSDLHGDSFHISFNGGAEGTQLKQLIIDGDLNTAGFGLGDLFFDTVAGGIGADGAHAFQIENLSTARSDASVTATVVDGSSRLVLDFTNFFAGDTLVFTIDVDEVQSYDPNETDQTILNEGFDPITSGVEFQNSLLQAEFIAPHYEDVSGSDKFRNRYDAKLTPTGLPLPADDDGGKRDRTAGAVASLQQVPKPISLQGIVYQDRNENLGLEASDRRLQGVTLELYRFDGSGYVSTGHTTTTNSLGEYEFGTALGLAPGKFQIREIQPQGYYSVGATTGLFAAGGAVGQTVAGNPDQLTEIDIPNGDMHATQLNFAENLPSSISGHVCVVVDGFDCFDASSTKEPLAGVTVQLRNSAGTLLETTTTDANGFYQFQGLRSGTYTVTQITPAGLIDGKARVGSEGGQVAGGSQITQVGLGGDTTATDYDFCEITPAELRGNAFYDQNNNGSYDSGETPLAGVSITLWDSSGNKVADTTTDAQGRYIFTGLKPGTYRVTEVTPANYLPGQASVGMVRGNTVGTRDASGDVLADIVLPAGSQGTKYDFGEILAGSIAGQVIVDVNGNCILDAQGEMALAGVRIELLDVNGVVLQTTTTDSDGRYKFDDLLPATYAVREVQPDGYFHGGQSAGSGGGDDAQADLIRLVNVNPGADLVEYDFCEVPPSSISGFVFNDFDRDCDFDTGEQPIAGVTITLFDGSGNVVATTMTDANGRYTFDGLRADSYTVVESQPAGFRQGGQRAGSGGGDDSQQDRISQINLGSGVDLVNYNFCEQEPGSISGLVFVDPDQDCVFDPGETTLAGVRIDLLNEQGTLIATTSTAADGTYRFDDLAPGKYTVVEHQPDGLFHGGQTAPAGNGDDSQADQIIGIDVAPGAAVTQANFCETPPAEIAGIVFVDPDLDCTLDPGETTLAGVRIDLLNEQGTVIATTQTVADGTYRFAGLAPGKYTVVEHQPDGYFHGGQMAPTGNGDDSLVDRISNIEVIPGAVVSEANFCETPPAQISGYVFQDGAVIQNATGQVPEDRSTVRDGVRTADDTPIAGVTMQLRLITGSIANPAQVALPGYYSGDIIEVQTDANGFYSFAGIQPGFYHITQVQPEDYVDSLDTPGSSGGISLNSQSEIDAFFSNPGNAGMQTGLRMLSDTQLMDVVLAVTAISGENSVENNFSEVLAEPVLPPPPPPEPPQPPEPPRVTPPTFTSLPGLTNPVQLWTPPPLIVGAAHALPPTWHLSVINGGQPRGSESGDPVDDLSVQRNADYLDVDSWSVEGMESTGLWRQISTGSADAEYKQLFDIPGSKPLAGDFNGDGRDEIALFRDGEWFIDANGDGHWDDQDIWVRLGNEGDQPVVGDWDRDGKDDVGIFGQRWQGDERAIAAEPGLPDPDNTRRGKFKNVPPSAEEAPDDPRLLKRGRHVEARADLIDHVFRFGGDDDVAVSGDFNGDGIATIGIYRGGRWILDVNGDGRATEADVEIELGEAGDIPLVGDFDNDGFDELAVLRGNRVLVDSDGNGQFDATDQVFELESTDGTIVVGDFDKDGYDEPVLHQSGQQQRILSARRAG